MIAVLERNSLRDFLLFQKSFDVEFNSVVREMIE